MSGKSKTEEVFQVVNKLAGLVKTTSMLLINVDQYFSHTLLDFWMIGR